MEMHGYYYEQRTTYELGVLRSAKYLRIMELEHVPETYLNTLEFRRLRRQISAIEGELAERHIDTELPR
jgi:hypothetical protein